MLDPYSEKYKKLKEKLINDTLSSSIHFSFCNKLEEVYQCKVLDCDLTRMQHNQKLRLEIFVFDQADRAKININEWDQIVHHNIDELRNQYKDEINRNPALQELMGYLNVSEAEIDDLFIILSPFIPCLRWDLNINLDKDTEATFFQQFLSDNDFRILKEFEVVVLLSNAQNLTEIEQGGLQETIQTNYVKLLDSTSPIKGAFANHHIHIYFEEEEHFYSTYGNLRNFLN